MGSASQSVDGAAPSGLLNAAAPHLALAHPTAAEKQRTWTLNHAEWGGTLSLDEYLRRERYLMTVPLARDGGMTHWILTNPSLPPLGSNAGQEKRKQESKGTTTTGPRPVLASCETIRKRVLVTVPGSSAVRDGLVHGVGSVFTYPEHRGKRYAGRMLAELGEALRAWQQPESLQKPQVVCSALWSDIGKVFYAEKGWAAYPSLHVEFPVPASAAVGEDENGLRDGKGARKVEEGGIEVTVTPITSANLSDLCARDEALLRARLPRVAQTTGRTAVAFVPDVDTMQWHLHREDFITGVLFGDSPPSPSLPSDATATTAAGPAAAGFRQVAREVPPVIKGALAEVCSGGRRRRVWAVWARNYHGDAAVRARADRSNGDSQGVGKGRREAIEENVDKNTLYVLRLAIDADADADAAAAADREQEEEEVEPARHLVAAFAAVLRAARREAAAWNLGRVDLWNPSATVRGLIERAGLRYRWVERDADSIPSLMWYGSGDEENQAEEGKDAVVWVDNEKYCWC
ncbi:hypothetical protein GGS23DRAFT_284241 [Durotheca rogersii]|uniref:uncharacterized protein n=1 Tax=Durotheca rogersii TaxID=419775 RepID=UPI00221E7A77|nr:uncharacterized protein GGS23DRAFT_284241 [Durotheca rogersii]KAI5866710.1 hypothetical protein GGS23DRAFT_284241 [Durotheca rogersii]